jgi:hypothetical protein
VDATSVNVKTTTTHAPTMAPAVISVRLSRVWLSIGASGIVSSH